MKRFLVAGCLLLFVLVMFPWPSFSQDTPDTPRLIIQEREFDFGKVREGEVIKHSFRVFNKGDKPLLIGRVKPG